MWAAVVSVGRTMSKLQNPALIFLYLRTSCEGFLFDGRERMFCYTWHMECMKILPLLGAFQGLDTT